MKTLVLLTTICSLVNGFSLNSTSDSKTIKNSNHNYNFDSSFTSSINTDDEFETCDFMDGSDSEGYYIDKDGNRVDYKTRGKSDDSIRLASNDDEYETNDFFSFATCVFDIADVTTSLISNYTAISATISQKKSGALFWAKKYIDKDFYSYDAFSCGTLTVELTNIPANCDYDLRVYKQESSPNSSNEVLEFDNYYKMSARADNSSESITLNVEPGTYYACVYSYNDATFDNTNKYTLSFFEEEDLGREGTIYDIHAGKKKGDIGAIWFSKYKPLGLTPITVKDDHAYYQYYNYATYPYIRHLADKYNSDENYIEYATLYVWDVTTKAIISEFASRLAEEVYAYTKWDYDKTEPVDFVLTLGSFCLSFAGSIICAIPGTEVLSAVLTIGGLIVSTISLARVNDTASVLSYLSSGTISRRDLYTFLISVKDTFAVGKGSNNNEVKMLRYRYRFINSNTEHFINWSPYALASDYNFHNESSIQYDHDHSPMNGYAEGISDSNEIKELLSK